MVRENRACGHSGPRDANPTQNVAPTFVRWNDSIGDCERKRADMIGNHAEGHICGLLRVEGRGLRAIRQCTRVFFAAQFFQLVEDRTEDVGLVVRDRARELGEVFCALNDCGGALETEPGVDMTLGEWNIFDTSGVSDPGYRLRVELDENQIPNLDATRVVFVHECAARVAIRRKIDM